MMLTTADGRDFEAVVTGPDDGMPVAFHLGTPSAAIPFGLLASAAAEAGVRAVTWSRPGYGDTPRRAGGPGTLADDVADTRAILDVLDIGDFATLGWSGGGPRALACAALAPDRCRAATSLAGVAPWDSPGLDYFAGMGPENVRDFEASRAGADAFAPLAEEEARELAAVTGAGIVAAFGELVDEVDSGALTGDFADHTAASFRHAVAQGAGGLLDDSLVLAGDWGFDVGSITVPVAVWQGRHDKMVPFGHGVWIADTVPGARRHLFDDEGHLTLLHRLPEMFVELRELSGL